jgi:hypothetical protein
MVPGFGIARLFCVQYVYAPLLTSLTLTRGLIAPYTAPHKEYFSTEQLVQGPLPQFAYQLHLASGEVERSVKDSTTIRQFLKGTYGAKGPNGELAFDPEKGIIEENLAKVGESRVLSGEVRSVPDPSSAALSQKVVLTEHRCSTSTSSNTPATACTRPVSPASQKAAQLTNESSKLVPPAPH